MKKIAIVLTLLAVLALGINLACTSQTTLAALVTTLGNASASIAALEGNTALAVQLKADTAVAAAAILAWKSGTAAQTVMEALGVVEDDLNLIPYIAPFAELVDIAIGTVDEVITIITGQSPPGTVTVSMTKGRVPHRHVALTGKTPKNRENFVKMWNKVAASDPKLAPAVIQ